MFTHRVGFMEKIPVPSKDTTYMCQGFDLPSDQDYHLVATESIIDNMNVAHHIVVYGCNAMSKEIYNVSKLVYKRRNLFRSKILSITYYCRRSDST